MAASRLTAQVAIIGVGRLLNMAAAAGTLVVLSRVMPSKAEYGAICQLLMLYVVLSQVFAVGLPQSTFYFLPRYTGGEKKGFLIQTILLLMLSGLVLGGGLYIGADGIGALLRSKELPELLRIFAIYPLFMLPTLAVEGTLLHINRPASVVLFSATLRVSMFLSLTIPTVMKFSLPHTVTIWMVSSAVMFLVALVLMLSTVRGLPMTWKPAMLREEWKFTLPLAGVTVLAICSSYLDRFFVSHAFGPAAFGAYTNGTIEVPTVTMVTNATAVVLLAEFSRLTSLGNASSVLPIWHSAMVKTAVLIFASLGFLAFWGHEAMRVLFSSRFAESGTIFSIYVWIIPLFLFCMQPLYVSLGATRTLMYVTAIDLTLGAICIPLFGHFYGIVGMALGSIIARYIGTGFWVQWYVRWLTRIGWKAFMPWRKIAIALLIALLAGLASRLLAEWLFPSVLLIGRFALALGAYVLMYISGLYLTRLLDIIVPARFLPLRGLRKEVTT